MTPVYFHRPGYPFPTAPPVDPFAKIKVEDCGRTKGCFRWVQLRLIANGLASQPSRIALWAHWSVPLVTSARLWRTQIRNPVFRGFDCLLIQSLVGLEF